MLKFFKLAAALMIATIVSAPALSADKPFVTAARVKIVVA